MMAAVFTVVVCRCHRGLDDARHGRDDRRRQVQVLLVKQSGFKVDLSLKLKSY